MTEEKKPEDKKKKTVKKGTKKAGRPKKDKPEWYLITERAALDGPDEGGKCVITTEGGLATDLEIFGKANKIDSGDIIVYVLGERIDVRLQAVVRKWVNKDDT